MLSISHLSKSYGVETILEDITFVVNPGERVGLVGSNGSGKSTLLRIIAGEERPDSGSVSLSPDATLGYLAQGMALGQESTVYETVTGGLTGWQTARKEVETLAGVVSRASGDALVQAMSAYGEALTRFEHLGGYSVEHRMAAILDGLGLPTGHTSTPLSAGPSTRDRTWSPLRAGPSTRDRTWSPLRAGPSTRDRTWSPLRAGPSTRDRTWSPLRAGLQTPISQLSGGERTRVGLARVLLAEPNILLLDEPTNHLDIQVLEWLESFLGSYPGAALIVSHDRTFLDRTATKILALDLKTHKIREYTGNYSDYAAQAARELAKTWEVYRDQQTEIRRMEADIHHTMMHAQSVELTTTSRQPTVRRYAKKVAKKAKSREKKLERYLESDERVDKPKKGWEMKLEFEETMRSGQIVLEMDDVGFAYPKSELPFLFQKVNATITYGERIALLGSNGSGKTTLFRIIVGKLQPCVGRVRLGASVRVGYMSQEQETLPATATPVELIQNVKAMSETDARNFLHYFLFEGDGALASVGKLSYGERARLILGKLVAEGANFLVLDEPVNHLDIPSRERFEAALNAFPGAVLAAVHDRAFIKTFTGGGRGKVWQLENGRLDIE